MARRIKYADDAEGIRPTGKDNIKIMRNSLVPATGTSCDLGDDERRWDHIYVNNFHTGDLHLENDRGSWSIVEEEDYLSITNNKTGKKYKFVLEEVED
tara:strand:- start:2745 stop:3038 length:294 start_codon:yes stop_codon:yes gene_type:complete